MTQNIRGPPLKRAHIANKGLFPSAGNCREEEQGIVGLQVRLVLRLREYTPSYTRYLRLKASFFITLEVLLGKIYPVKQVGRTLVLFTGIL